MKGRLTEHQERMADRLLDAESLAREHLVISLSGAHAYGFPSHDSDLDLKAIHIAPTAALLGLQPRHVPAERMEVLEGVEVDYSSNELQPVLLGILQGNGNYIERVLGAITVRALPELETLRPRVRAVLSRRIHRHYRGFAQGQLREWEKGGFRSVKKLLYVLRTTLTGTHALRTGEVETDVTVLLEPYGFGEAHALVKRKQRRAHRAGRRAQRAVAGRGDARVRGARRGGRGLRVAPGATTVGRGRARGLDARRAAPAVRRLNRFPGAPGSGGPSVGKDEHRPGRAWRVTSAPP